MSFGSVLVWDLMLSEFTAQAVTLLAVGCLCYFVGIAFFLLGEYKPIYHVIWHLFVIAAAALHWFAIYFFIVSVDLGAGDSATKTVVIEMVDSVNAAAASATASATSMLHSLG
jgi:hypothetical protein